VKKEKKERGNACVRGKKNGGNEVGVGGEDHNTRGRNRRNISITTEGQLVPCEARRKRPRWPCFLD